MSSELPSFGHLTLSHRASGETVRLVRSPDEVVLLAFDTQTKRLVELHLLREGQPIEGALKKSAMERAQQASEIRGPTFMRVLEVGEDQGVVYYTSNLNEGEFVSDYVTRRGALPPATVFSLLLQLLDDVMLLSDRHRLVSQLRLDRLMITTVEDTFLQLRLYDFGLGTAEGGAAGNSRQVLQVCELVFLMLTGKSFAGDNPDRYPALTALPMSLRTTVRAALVDPNNTPVSLEKLRDDLREAYSSQVSSIQARNTRKQLVVTATLQPRSQLQDLLLEGVPVERVLGSHFRVENEENSRRYPFSIPCINSKRELPITVHLLPPSRVVDKAQYDAVPLQSWRFSPEKHPNILRSLSLWESPEWSFLTEEREPGFSLSRLLTERITLNPSEVAVVLRQVNAGIEQALDCGVTRLELHPSNLFLRVGKAGPMLAREHERLMQKRLDAWPPFHIKVRPHVTMRNLYEPPLAEPPDLAKFESEHLADREHRSRSFVALAAYLLTGQRQIADTPVFPESVAEPLAVFVREVLESNHLRGPTLSPSEFVDRFESIMSGPAVPDFASRLRGASVAMEEMESVGSVSDFDDDQTADDFDDDEVSPISRRLRAHEFEHISSSKRSSNWPVMAAAAVVILGLIGWWFMPRSKSVESPIAIAPSTESKPLETKPVAEKKAEEPKKSEVAAVKAPEQAAPKATEPAKPVVSVAPTPAPAKSAPSEPTKTTASTSPAPAPLPAFAPEKPQIDLSKPPPPVTVPNPVIIRKAILPTPEEIAKFKQGQAKPQQAPHPVQVSPTPTAPQQPGSPQQIGTLPAMNMAQPLDPVKKS